MRHAFGRFAAAVLDLSEANEAQQVETVADSARLFRDCTIEQAVINRTTGLAPDVWAAPETSSGSTSNGQQIRWDDKAEDGAPASPAGRSPAEPAP
jgi:hypothetical protein